MHALPDGAVRLEGRDHHGLRQIHLGDPHRHQALQRGREPLHPLANLYPAWQRAGQLLWSTLLWHRLSLRLRRLVIVQHHDVLGCNFCRLLFCLGLLFVRIILFLHFSCFFLLSLLLNFYFLLFVNFYFLLLFNFDFLFLLNFYLLLLLLNFCLLLLFLNFCLLFFLNFLLFSSFLFLYHFFLHCLLLRLLLRFFGRHRLSYTPLMLPVVLQIFLLGPGVPAS
mmetsp:Transcript_19868/g.46888  ORF Transcript_19868/g.46888 Transcript_19868/m.46888 type:complete len:223 (+) Transcript_19868:725-1393(+)